MRCLVRLFVLGFIVLTSSWGWSAERTFDFTTNRVGEVPVGWRALVAGEGQPGEWKVLLDDVPPLLPPISPNAPQVTKQAVVAQTSTDSTDERFPLLLFNGDKYADFTFMVRFKIVGGKAEQIGGIVFRAQDEKNFYVVRASALGGNVRFYKFVDGKRQPAVGPNVEIRPGVWYQLTVDCQANRIRVRLNNKDLIPELTDNSFPAGRIGFFTKSDSQVYFVDPRIIYKPIESLASTMVRTTMEKNPRLLGLKIFGRTSDNDQLRVLASSDPAEIGQPAAAAEAGAVKRDVPFFGREQDRTLVTYPLHDRNGEAIGAVKFTLRHFKGQTDANAMARVRPIALELDKQVAAARDLVE